MKSRSRSAPRKNRLQLFMLALLGVVLFLGALEAGMRILGKGMLAEQEFDNRILPGDEHAVRIVTIGESTVADFMADGHHGAWPRYLERKLTQEGVKARVYNLARPASNTSLILERLPEQLDHFHPQIVISMMGRNDTDIGFPRSSGWIGEFRVVKLYRRLVGSMALKRVAPVLAPRDLGEPGVTREILSLLRSEKPGSAMALIGRQIRKLDATARAQYYLYLAQSIDPLPEGLSARRNMKQILMGRSVASVFNPWAVAGLVRLLAQGRMEDECLDVAYRMQAHGWGLFSDAIITDFLNCAAISKELQSVRFGEWLRLLKELSPEGQGVEFEDRTEKKRKNYQAVHRLLASRNVFHIAVQHPTEDVEALRNYFKSDPSQANPDPAFAGIYFVENRKNFLSALGERSYSALFLDTIGGTYGHLTELGHALIADAVYPALKDAIQRVDSSAIKSASK